MKYTLAVCLILLLSIVGLLNLHQQKNALASSYDFTVAVSCPIPQITLGNTGSEISADCPYTLYGTNIPATMASYNVDVEFDLTATIHGSGHPPAASGIRQEIIAIDPESPLLPITFRGSEALSTNADYTITIIINDHIRAPYTAGTWSFTTPAVGDTSSSTNSTSSSPSTTSQSTVMQTASSSVSTQIPSTTPAKFITRSFGGKILSTTTPGVTCGAQYGMITIKPAGIFPPTGYTITATTRTVSVGGWILGLYNATPTTGICYTDTAPPISLPSFTITKFGSSKGFSF